MQIAMSNEYLTLRLGTEFYGIDVSAVKEICNFMPVTRFSGVPSFILGIANLRGDVVPIAGFRLKFSVGEATYNEFTIIIMVQIEDRIAGIVVDEVCDVITVLQDDIEQAPELGKDQIQQYFAGLTTIEGEMIVLLNIWDLMKSDIMALS